MSDDRLKRPPSVIRRPPGFGVPPHKVHRPGPENEPDMRRDVTMPKLPQGAHLEMLGDLLPGRGNLDLRMLFASIIGPRRLAFGAKSTIKVSEQTPTLIARNNQGTHPWFVAVSLSIDIAGPIKILFSNGPVLDKGSAIPILLTNNTGQSGSTFETTLGPGDELFAQCDPSVPGGTQCAVTQVMF